MAEGLITLNSLLTTFRASGVYTIYRDASKSPNVQSTEPIRLVVGYSKTGIFNAPVFINKGDRETAERLFGPRDITLERKGSWFHLALDVALEEGPVIALNLLKVNNELDGNGNPTINADTAEYRSFSTDVATLNGNVKKKLLASYFNKERFWFADKNYLLATRDIQDQKSILNLANVSKNKLSFIIKKSSFARQFAVTARDWYVNEDLIPKYIKPTDLISDYFVDVYVINGDFSPAKYTQLSTDPIFGQYFDNNGLIASKLEEFVNNPNVNLVRLYTGCIIPEFRDKNGQSLDIESLINRETLVTGVLCAIDKRELDAYETNSNIKYLDMVGHRLLTNNVSNANFLSYKRKLTQDFTYTKKSSFTPFVLHATTGVTVTSNVKSITVQVTNSNPNFNTLHTELEIGDLFRGVTTPAGLAAGITITEPALQVTSVLKTVSAVTFTVTNQFKSLENSNSGSFVDLWVSPPVTEILATASGTITNAGSNGNTIQLYSNTPTPILLGSYTVQNLDTPTDVATGLIADVMANTGNHGYTGTSNLANFTITAPSGSGATANSYTLSVTVTGTVAATAGSFSGGVTGTTGDFHYDSEINRFDIDGSSTFYYADKKSQVYLDWKSGELTNGDKVEVTGNTYYVKFELVNSQGNIFPPNDFRELLKISFFTDSNLTIPITPGNAPTFGSTLDSMGYPVTTPTLFNIISLVGSINKRLPATVVNSKTVRIPISFVNDIKVGHYLSGEDVNGDPIMARILSIKRHGSPVPTHLDVECDNTIKLFVDVNSNTQVERFIPLAQMFNTFDITTLEGYTVKPSHMPDGTNARMKEIYSVLTETNLAEAMADPEMISFRYFVDTFNHGLEPNSKSILSKFIKKRQKCLGILNTPTVQEFRDSQDPRFTDTPSPSDPLPVLNIEYINDGGNIAENPTFLYTLPEEEQGASFVGFFFPNLEVRLDNGDIIEPVAAPFVSNNFIRKYRSNPFKAVAGTNSGVITGTAKYAVSGVTYPLTKEQRGALEEKGINPIYKKADGRVIIGGNETSYQKFNSILNNIHARDTLITMEIDTEQILDNFPFEFNNDILRTTVEAALTQYYANIRDGFGAIEDFKIIFDRSNNPFWVTQNGAAVIDVELTLTEVAKKFINRVTLTRGNNPVVGNFIAI